MYGPDTDNNSRCRPVTKIPYLCAVIPLLTDRPVLHVCICVFSTQQELDRFAEQNL